ncbi:glycoside hydrolase family 78 protein, partial [Glonium stellatum]
MHLKSLALLAISLLSYLPYASSQDTSWQQYVIAPESRTVSPAKVHSTTGNVTNANGLLSNGSGITTLTRLSSSSTIPTIVLDFGLNIVGHIEVDFAGASSNNPGLGLAFSETLEYLTDISDFTRSDNGDTITNGIDYHAVPAGVSSWTDSWGCSHGSQVCADGIHGFRYLRISLNASASDAPYAEPTGTIQISRLSLNFSAFLGTPDTYSGWFECSDDQLNQFWYNAAYTNEMCIDTFRANEVDPRNAQSSSILGKQVIFDGAKRDRDPYVGDVAVSGRTIYLTHTSASIAARNVLADLADHQRSSDGWIPPASINNYTLPLYDYPLWWVTASWDYILYSGDMGYASDYYPNLISVLDGAYYANTTSATGLLSKPTTNTGDYAFLNRYGIITYNNALYVLALQAGAAIASTQNDNSTATRWLSRAATVSAAINTQLWDSSAGAYLDDADDSTRHAQDGNALAVLGGIANSTRAISALTYMANHTTLPYGNAFMDTNALVPDGTTRVYAFISYFDISARFAAGLAASALDEITQLYGWMMTHDPSSTFWEGISTNGTMYEAGFTSAAHGWSTGVVPALSNYVLGVVPTAPGFARWSVKPYPVALAWARGRVGTPGGALDVSWAAG